MIVNPLLLILVGVWVVWFLGQRKKRRQSLRDVDHHCGIWWSRYLSKAEKRAYLEGVLDGWANGFTKPEVKAGIGRLIFSSLEMRQACGWLDRLYKQTENRIIPPSAAFAVVADEPYGADPWQEAYQQKVAALRKQARDASDLVGELRVADYFHEQENGPRKVTKEQEEAHRRNIRSIHNSGIF